MNQRQHAYRMVHSSLIPHAGVFKVDLSEPKDRRDSLLTKFETQSKILSDSEEKDPKMKKK